MDIKTTLKRDKLFVGAMDTTRFRGHYAGKCCDVRTQCTQSLDHQTASRMESHRAHALYIEQWENIKTYSVTTHDKLFVGAGCTQRKRKRSDAVHVKQSVEDQAIDLLAIEVYILRP